MYSQQGTAKKDVGIHDTLIYNYRIVIVCQEHAGSIHNNTTSTVEIIFCEEGDDKTTITGYKQQRFHPRLQFDAPILE